MTEWGRCHQAARESLEVCTFHARWLIRDGSPDRSYHRKIVLGLLEPAEDYLNKSELRATMNGRYRGDGRRLDFYVLWDPNPLELEQ